MTKKIMLFYKYGQIFLLSIISRGKYLRLTYGPQREKTCPRKFANHKGADQPDQRLCYSLIGKYHNLNLLQFSS